MTPSPLEPGGPEWRGSPLRWTRADAASLGSLFLFAAVLLAVSWRKWPDAVIDFGREVYVPWRLTQGAVLYRDVQLYYGPLSKYFNALVFEAFGIGLTSLIWTNLAVVGGILVLLYAQVRAGWGRLAATAAGAIFVSMFAFAHLLSTGNFNYVLPYAHEATHGMLVTLGLVGVWRQVVLRPAAGNVVAAGVLAGLAVLLKPEFILAAGAISGGGFLLLAAGARRAMSPAPSLRLGGLFLAGFFLPMLVAAVVFWAGAGVSFLAALHYANNAWMSVGTFSSMYAQPFQRYVLGTDAVGDNLLKIMEWGGLTVALVCALAGSCRRFRLRTLSGYAGVAVWAMAVAFSGYAVPWLKVGAALPGLLLFAALMEAARWRNPPREGAAWGALTARILLGLAGGALLARMALNPRVEHYGFFQAPLAAAVGAATLVRAAPDFFGLREASRKVYLFFIISLLGLCGHAVIQASTRWYAEKTLPVGAGPDHFWAYPRPLETSGTIVEFTRQYLSHDPGARSLLVLPEGVMLNYLARLPGVIPAYEFVPALLEGGRQEEMVRQLAAHPPDRVVLLSRLMRDFGVDRFGDTPAHGALLIDFLKNNYDVVYREGADPTVSDGEGFAIYALRTAGVGSAP